MKKSNTLTVETMWGDYPNCHVKFNRYYADDSLCIDLWNDEDGAIAKLTVCLSEKKLKGTNRSYLDDNNCPWGEEFVEKYHLGKPVGIGFSGFCTYTLIERNMEELQKYM